MVGVALSTHSAAVQAQQRSVQPVHTEEEVDPPPGTTLFNTRWRDWEVVEAAILMADVGINATATLIDFGFVQQMYGDDEIALSQAHERAARRLLRSAKRHGGLLCKFGQHISTLRLAVPPEYSRILKGLTDKQPSSNPGRVANLLCDELGACAQDIFAEWDPEPLASASIAQVHRARLSDGRLVAVKVMHPGLETRITGSMIALRMAFRLASIFFPTVAHDWTWLLPEFEDAIQLELDLVQEAVNCTRTKSLLRDFKLPVDTPQVIWPLTTRRVLTMHFVDNAHRVDDLDSHSRHGLNNAEIAQALVVAVATLAYEHGLVLADPHHANVLTQPSQKNNGKFTLWLLDHGLYRRLDESTRRTLCRLWEALASRQFGVAAEAAHTLGLGRTKEEALALARLMLTANLASDQSALGTELPKKDAVFAELKRLLPNGTSDLARLLRFAPRDLLFTLRSASLLRGQHASLGASRRDRYLAFARAASRGLCVPKIDDEKFDPDDPARFDALPSDVAAILLEPNRVLRPNHPVNRRTASEVFRATRSSSWLYEIRATLRLFVLISRIFLVEFYLTLRRYFFFIQQISWFSSCSIFLSSSSSSE